MIWKDLMGVVLGYELTNFLSDRAVAYPAEMTADTLLRQLTVMLCM